MVRLVRILLEIEAPSEPITGRVGPEREPGRPFVGYIELISTIEELRGTTMTDNQHDDNGG